MTTIQIVSMVAGTTFMVSGSSVGTFVFLEDRYVAESKYSEDISGLIQQQQAAERRTIQRDIRRIKSSARSENRNLSPIELDDLDELQDQLDEIEK